MITSLISLMFSQAIDIDRFMFIQIDISLTNQLKSLVFMNYSILSPLPLSPLRHYLLITDQFANNWLRKCNNNKQESAFHVSSWVDELNNNYHNWMTMMSHRMWNLVWNFINFMLVVCLCAKYGEQQVIHVRLIYK